MRLNDHLGNRHGLQTHLRRHSGQFGYDSNYGSPTTEGAYVTTPSFFYKIQRNTKNIIKSGSSLSSPLFDKKYDNGYVTTPIPSSDYQYYWISASLGGNYSYESGKQYIFGHAPKDGLFKDKSGLNLASGSITINSFVGGQNLLGKHVYVTDGTNGIYFRFKSSDANPLIPKFCSDTEDTLYNCNVTEVLTGSSITSAWDNLYAAMTSSILDLTIYKAPSGKVIALTASYIDEKFNNPINTNATNISTFGFKGGKFDMIPAITFPTASEIYGEQNG